MTSFCNAKHTDSPNGCYEYLGHETSFPKPHKGYRVFESEPFFWEDAPAPAPAPEGTTGVYLTEAELYLIGYTFGGNPRAKDLMTKIDTALEALK